MPRVIFSEAYADAPHPRQRVSYLPGREYLVQRRVAEAAIAAGKARAVDARAGDPQESAEEAAVAPSAMQQIARDMREGVFPGKSAATLAEEAASGRGSAAKSKKKG